MEACIIYGYHTTGATTLEVVTKHYAALCRDNPRCVVVPITCGYKPWIEGTIDVADNPTTCYFDPSNQDGSLWAHNDQLLWRYLQDPRRIQAERYIFFDWDVLSRGMSVQEFYGDTWNADFVGVELVTPYSHPHWVWFSPYPNIRGRLGVLPFCGTLFSAHAAQLLRDFNWNCIAPNFYLAQNEFRVAMAVRTLGLYIRAVPHRAVMLHTYGGPCRLSDAPGIYHPAPRTAE